MVRSFLSQWNSSDRIKRKQLKETDPFESFFFIDDNISVVFKEIFSKELEFWMRLVNHVCILKILKLPCAYVCLASVHSL